MSGRLHRICVAVAAGVLGCAVALPAAAAPDDPAVVVTGVQPSVGAVEFLLAARNLPPGTRLTDAAVTVTARGVPLTTTVRAVPAGERGATSAVVLVVDVSGSMAGGRIAAARQAARDYADSAPPGVALGLVTVSDRASVVLSPTVDRAAFGDAVRSLAARGETALHDGVLAAAELLDPKETDGAAQFVQRRIVVLSDGADTASRASAEELVEQLGRRAPTVDAVAFGDKADRAALTAVCETTGGRVAEAGDAEALRSVFRTMAAGLSAPVIVSAAVPPTLAGAQTVLAVRAQVGPAAAATEVPVTFRPDPRAAPARVPFAVAPARGPALPWTIAAVAGSVLGLALLAWRLIPDRSRVRSRLRELERFSRTGRRPAAAAAGGGQMIRAALAVSEHTVARPDRRERLELALDRAGLPLRAAEWQLIRCGCAVGGAVTGVLLLPWWAGLPLGTVAGWLAAGQFLRWRAGRRARAFANQLPDSLQLVVGSLRSGFSLAQSIDALVREGTAPVADELGRALAETRLGGDLEDALERVGTRNGSQDMEWLVMAIRIQREVGGNLSEVLETAVATMRERGQLGRHVRALSAEGRLSAWILLGMPVVLGGWMFAFRREYLSPLYTSAPGLLMLGAAVVMVLLGALWLRKIVQVRV